MLHGENECVTEGCRAAGSSPDTARCGYSGAAHATPARQPTTMRALSGDIRDPRLRRPRRKLRRRAVRTRRCRQGARPGGGGTAATSVDDRKLGRPGASDALAGDLAGGSAPRHRRRPRCQRRQRSGSALCRSRRPQPASLRAAKDHCCICEAARRPARRDDGGGDLGDAVCPTTRPRRSPARSRRRSAPMSCC